MSITYCIDKALGCTFVLWDKVVTVGEYIAHVQRLLSDADWPPAQCLQLSDLRTVSLDSSINDVVLQKAAELFGTHPKISNLKVAILASKEFNNALNFERKMAQYRSSIIVFNSLETACMWLGIDGDVAAQTLKSLRALSNERMK